VKEVRSCWGMLWDSLPRASSCGSPDVRRTGIHIQEPEVEGPEAAIPNSTPNETIGDLWKWASGEELAFSSTGRVDFKKTHDLIYLPISHAPTLRMTGFGPRKARYGAAA
jgi:hypothetical protein